MWPLLAALGLALSPLTPPFRPSAAKPASVVPAPAGSEFGLLAASDLVSAVSAPDGPASAVSAHPGSVPIHPALADPGPAGPEHAEIPPAAPQPPESAPSKPPKLRHAPEFSLQDLNGNAVDSLYAHRPVTIVHFWVSSCVPCIREIPHLNRLAARYEPFGAGLFAVSSDDATRSELRQIAKAYDIRHTVLIADRAVIGDFGGLEGFPTTFLVDRQGRIVERHIGASEEAQHRVEAGIRQILSASGKPLPDPPW